MNDIRRTILWVIFGFSMVLLWDQWQIHNGKKATFFPAPVQQTAAAVEGAKPAVVPAAAPATAGAAAAAAAAAPAVPKERFDVSTDVLKLTLDTEGGTLVRSELLKYADTADSTKKVVLLDDSKDRLYRAQTGVVATKAGDAFPMHTTVMSVSGPRALTEGQDEFSITFTSPEVGGLKLVRRIPCAAVPMRLRSSTNW
jgi:YidC/Oxa1 family membrane protein insertase